MLSFIAYATKKSYKSTQDRQNIALYCTVSVPPSLCLEYGKREYRNNRLIKRVASDDFIRYDDPQA